VYTFLDWNNLLEKKKRLGRRGFVLLHTTKMGHKEDGFEDVDHVSGYLDRVNYEYRQTL